jgi:YD repeat-containing protein
MKALAFMEWAALSWRKVSRVLSANRRTAIRAVTALLIVWLGGFPGGVSAASYTYDALGRLTQVIEADGSMITYTYDAVGNVLSITRSGSTVAPPVVISSITPTSGPVGTVVTVNGSGFLPSPAQNSVTIGGVAASVTSADVTQLTVTVPSGAVSGHLIVSNGYGSATSSATFTVNSLAISSITPTIGAAGTSVTIAGTGFDPSAANDAVTFNTANATVATASTTQLTVPVPTGATSGRIRVTTSAGTAVSTMDFIVPPTGVSSGSVVMEGRVTPNGDGLIYTVDVSNQYVVAVYDAVVGEPITLVLTNVSMGGTFTVYAPDGSIVATGNTANNTALDLPAATQAGTYSIYFKPGTAIGSATVRVVSDATGTLNASGTALPVALAAGQNASYSFAGVAGTPYTLSDANLTTNPAGQPVYAKILNPDGTVLKDCGSFGIGYVTSCDFTTPGNGNYTVRIDPSGAAAASFTFLFSADFTAALVPNTPVTVSLPNAGQHASLTFTATAGQTLALAFSSVSLVPNNQAASIVIYKPDGTALTSGSVSNNNGYTFNLQNLPAGTYTTLVSPTNNATSTMQAALANGVVVTAPVDGTTTSIATSVPGQNAYLSFAATAGQSYSVALTAFTTNPSSINYLTYAVYAPNGAYVTSGYCYTTMLPGCEFGLQNAASSGVYSVLIQAAGPATMSFGLTVTQDIGGSLTAGAQPTSLNFSSPGQSASLTFTATAGQTASLNLGSLTLSPPDGYVSITIYNSSGVYIMSANASAGSGATINLPNLAAGTYTALITPINAATGTGQVSLLAAAGGSLTSDGSGLTTTTSAPGQNAYYTFSAQAGQSFGIGISALTMTPASSSNYLVMQVNRPDGSYWSSAYCYTTQPGCSISLMNVPQTGTYRVQVMPAGYLGMSYQINLSMDPAASLALDTPLALNLCAPGENALLNFTATAGQTVAFNVGGLSITPSNGSLTGTVYDANGALVTNFNATAANSGTANLPALAGGTYSVLLAPYGAATCGLQAVLASGVTPTLVADGSTTTVATTAEGQYIYASFAGTAGQSLSLAVTNLVTAASPYNYMNFTVYRPDGSYWTSVSCYATTVPGCATSLFNLPTTGTYKVTITPAGQVTMSMGLTLSQDVTAPLAIGAPVNLSLSKPGQNALLTFMATAGQTVTVGTGSQVMVPAGTQIYTYVYNAAGSLLGSTVGSPSSSLTLSSLPAGSYSVLIFPTVAATGTLQVSLN